MSLSIAEWVETEVNPIKQKYSKREMAEQFFFRNELRPHRIDESLFFSPADGIILNQKIVNSREQLMEVKGVKYTLRDAFQDPYFDGGNKLYMIMDIFLTYYNVHYTKLPYTGIINYYPVDPIISNNKPMVFLENKLLQGIIDFSKCDFTFLNERVIVEVRCPMLYGYTYYLINIADSDINTIIIYPEEGDILIQNSSLGQIRYGSQVSFVLPLSKHFDFKFCEEVGRVVKAGVDPLVKIIF